MVPFIGAATGAVTIILTGGFVLESIGWAWLFYIPGILSLFWCILWSLFVFDIPEDHPTITENEANLISDGKLKSSDQKDIPYRDLLKSSRVFRFSRNVLNKVIFFILWKFFKSIIFARPIIPVIIIKTDRKNVANN